MVTMKQLRDYAGKFKYVLIVIAAGMGLMLLPEEEAESPTQHLQEVSVSVSLEQSLEEILSRIQGVGKVQVLLTESQGEKTIYVFDESSGGDSHRTDAVILTDSTRSQTGLISQILPPMYMGAVVVCQGGDSPSVCLAVVEAVCDATGLTADKISVLKMK